LSKFDSGLSIATRFEVFRALSPGQLGISLQVSDCMPVRQSCKLHRTVLAYSSSEVQCSTEQSRTVPYRTVQYSTVQYSTVRYSSVQCSTVQYSTLAVLVEQHISASYYSTDHCSTVRIHYKTVQIELNTKNINISVPAR
jgi:hypothetical protein